LNTELTAEELRLIDVAFGYIKDLRRLTKDLDLLADSAAFESALKKVKRATNIEELPPYLSKGSRLRVAHRAGG